jgi:hypothetical protein
MLSRPVAWVGALSCHFSNTISCFVCAVLGFRSLLVLVGKLGLERTQVQHSEQPVCEEGKEYVERDESKQDAKVPIDS